ncbi:MAG: hypothetical protein CMD81_03915 [Gammaproteobacteria bacterium]|nr:hypothetical protein [Gammaproteobacteria bacterium]HBF09332.1 hypothetical protein [Gammaproteobacteria bacterium]|tara:strand:+ start:1375 stop:1785 length:411 start_codon:yes stop_codon:yes gene_type:complete
MKKALFALLLLSNSVFAASPHKVEIIDTDTHWNVYKVRAISKDNTTIIRGKMTANQSTPLAQGHIDIAAFDKKGNKIATSTASYTPGILTNRIRQRGGVTFRQELPKIPENAIIKVAFHKNGYDQTAPSHDKNIAH